jgi:prohead protease|nr:MAG TPA: prohead protease [Caudoviricetes sp.]
MEIINKSIATKTNDVDEQGRVVIAVNAIGNEDADGDISMPGSFNKTLKEDFARLKWFLNHDPCILLGVPISGEEKDDLVQMTSQFNMKKQISRDTYEDYKLYAEHGRTLEHSIGVNAINRNKSNPKEVLQWKMWEYSTLTNWGANERTPLLDIKGMNTISAEEHIKFLEEAVKMKYSDAKLKAITQSIDVIRKALLGDTIVKCSCCGEVFDYDNQPEIVLKEQVIDAVKSYDSWMKEGVAYKEIMKLANDIRSEVMTLIHTRKSINELSKHVLCPKCCNHVSKNDVVIKKEESKFSLKDLVDKIK